jgi:hypothetical protein
MAKLRQARAQDLHTLYAHLERLEEMARHAEPEDQARLLYTIHLAAVAIEAAEQAKRVVLRIKQQRAVSRNDALRWRNEAATLMAEVRTPNKSQ